MTPLTASWIYSNYRHRRGWNTPSKALLQQFFYLGVATDAPNGVPAACVFECATGAAAASLGARVALVCSSNDIYHRQAFRGKALTPVPTVSPVPAGT